MIKVGSLFDGIGGWLLATTHSGAVPTFSCEIDPFPASVSHAHFPDVIQYGDVTKVKGDEIEPVDIICAGSPCQDLSIAGERKGLDGNRSSLFYEALRIVREMREKTNETYPKFFIWENVTGAFSSNGRRDFQAVLEKIGQTDIPMPKSGRWAKSGMVRSKKCGIAWRTLDAQFWGVPQHRERIFLIAGFGKWGGYVKVLFEPESLCGDNTKIEKSGEAVAANSRYGVKEAGAGHGPIVFPQRAYGEYDDSEVGSTLRANGGNIGGESENIAVVYENNRKDARYTARTDNAPTLTSMMGTGGGNVPLTISKSYSLCISHTGKHGPPFKEKVSFCLTCEDHHVAERVVRKLTPRECERLQGLPDDYTAYGSDSKRYKALGNGMAQPCADYVMGQVVKAIMRGLEQENDG